MDFAILIRNAININKLFKLKIFQIDYQGNIKDLKNNKKTYSTDVKLALNH